MHYDEKNVLVLGGGVSGIAAALLLLSKGCKVTLADSNDKAELKADLQVLPDEPLLLHMLYEFLGYIPAMQDRCTLPGLY